jgi:formamidopyrimidine-DNA glycosylase
MPELPEVETVCRGLRETVFGKTIVRVDTNAPKNSIVVSTSIRPHDFSLALANRTILGVTRRGKNILIALSGDLVLWVHLKMTGHFFYDETPVAPGKHDLVVFHLTDGHSACPTPAGAAPTDAQPAPSSLRGATRLGGARRSNPSSQLPDTAPADASLSSTSLRVSRPPRRGDRSNLSSSYLRFNDYRRFGRLRLFNKSELWEQKGLVELGPEPLELSAADFVALCRKRPRQLKPALLDQSFLAGVGNIYADESLWAAKLHPQRLTTSVSPKKLTDLHGHIQRLLKLAIRKAGTSVDSYSGVNGQPGLFQKYLKVYDREGKPCVRCKAKIIRRKLGSRSAHFCPRCQKLK